MQGLLEENLITPLDDASLMSEAGELFQLLLLCFLLILIVHRAFSTLKWFDVRKSIRPVKLSDDLLAWLFIRSQMKVRCMWSS